VLRRWPHKILVSILAIFALVFLYQNCSTKTLTKQPTQQAGISGGTGGNGDFYEGKPEPGTYYRTAPDSRCNPLGILGATVKVLSSIMITDTAAFISELNLTTCNTSNRELTFDELEQSIYNRDYLGFSEGIYEKQDLLNLLTLNETWCQVQTDAYAIDVVVQTNALGLLPQATQYSAIRNLDQTITVNPSGSFNVSRTYSSSVVTYTAADFALSVDTSQPLSADGKRSGHVQTTLDGNAVSTDVECRSGGLLDPIL
jgi:hypothetical protein